jgi:hypothetical protein
LNSILCSDQLDYRCEPPPSIGTTCPSNGANITITTQSDIDALGDCTIITVDLVFGQNSNGTLNFPNVQYLEQGIIGHSINVTAIDFPSLITVCGGIDISDAPFLETLNMSKATGLTGIDIKIVNTPLFVDLLTDRRTPLKLGSLELGGSNEGYGDLNMTQCVGQLTLYDTSTVNYFGLLYLGNLTVYGVENFALEGLLSVNGTVNITNTANVGLSFQNLTSVDGSLLVSDSSFNQNVDLPSLVSVGGDIIFQNISEEYAVNFSSLTTANNLALSDNEGVFQIEISSRFSEINDLLIYSAVGL